MHFLNFICDINTIHILHKIAYLLYVENGLLFDPYQGSFNESPAFPSYPSISNL